jgi:hypothetical protein
MVMSYQFFFEVLAYLVLIYMGMWYIDRRLEQFESRLNSDSWLKIDDMNIHIIIDGEMCEYKITTGVTACNLNSQYVEKWLNDRGLMMTPKGTDFRVKVGSKS